jgi:hypothetical protein
MLKNIFKKKKKIKNKNVNNHNKIIIKIKLLIKELFKKYYRKNLILLLLS